MFIFFIISYNILTNLKKFNSFIKFIVLSLIVLYIISPLNFLGISGPFERLLIPIIFLSFIGLSSVLSLSAYKFFKISSILIAFLQIFYLFAIVRNTGINMSKDIEILKKQRIEEPFLTIVEEEKCFSLIPTITPYAHIARYYACENEIYQWIFPTGILFTENYDTEITSLNELNNFSSCYLLLIGSENRKRLEEYLIKNNFEMKLKNNYFTLFHKN